MEETPQQHHNVKTFTLDGDASMTYAQLAKLAAMRMDIDTRGWRLFVQNPPDK